VDESVVTYFKHFRATDKISRLKVLGIPDCVYFMFEKVKIKVKFPLCLTQRHIVKTYGEWRYSSTHS